MEQDGPVAAKEVQLKYLNIVAYKPTGRSEVKVVKEPESSTEEQTGSDNSLEPPSQAIPDQSDWDLDLDWIMGPGPADSSSDNNVLVLPEESMDDLLSSVDLSFLNDCIELEQWFIEPSADGDLSQR